MENIFLEIQNGGIIKYERLYLKKNVLLTSLYYYKDDIFQQNLRFYYSTTAE
jgi:hypothetical protein